MVSSLLSLVVVSSLLSLIMVSSLLSLVVVSSLLYLVVVSSLLYLVVVSSLLYLVVVSSLLYLIVVSIFILSAEFCGCHSGMLAELFTEIVHVVIAHKLCNLVHLVLTLGQEFLGLADAAFV